MSPVASLTRRRSPLIAVVATVLIFVVSCSDSTPKFMLRADYSPVGKELAYSLKSQRMGTNYEDGRATGEINVKIEGEIKYTTLKMLTNDIAVVREDNRWSWDEPRKDGTVERETAEYAYRISIAPTGKVVAFEMITEASPAWQTYAKHYYEQGMPIFPDSAIAVGQHWTQTANVILPDGSSEQASTTYRLKGTAPKHNYNCAIIEYNGTMVLPMLADPTDSTQVDGVDWIETTGMIYYAIDEGIAVSSEARMRFQSERTMTRKEGSRKSTRREFEETVSYVLTSVK